MKRRSIYSIITAFMLMICMTLTVSAYEGSSPFRDVAPESPWFEGIVYAAQEGITAGTGDDCFSPELPVTVRQWAVMVCRAIEQELPQEDTSFGAEAVRAGYDMGWLELNAFLNPDTRMTRGALYESAFHAFDIPIYDFDLYDDGTELSPQQNCIRIGAEISLCKGEEDATEMMGRAEAVHTIYYLMTQELEVSVPEILSRLDIRNPDDFALNPYLKEIQKVPQPVLARFEEEHWSYWLDCDYLADLSKRLNMSCIGAAVYQNRAIYVAQPNATIHEFGHFLHGVLGFPNEFNQLYAEEAANVIKLMREYSAKNAHEYFADYFTYWIKYQTNAEQMARLQAVSPKTYAYFSELEASGWCK